MCGPKRSSTCNLDAEAGIRLTEKRKQLNLRYVVY